MNYTNTLDYLYRQLPMFQRVGPKAFKKDLNNIIALCKVLGQPETAFPSVHIAGTNGKGSTTHILAAFLQTAGYRVGVYTSPHYRDFRERIKINGDYISKDEVVEFVARYRSNFEPIQPSFFELTVGMAFDHFRRHTVDIAIIETGLGGRLDSTNVLQPLLSVITNIGHDHQQFLGDTLPKIASEKAGIIKPNTPVVIGESHPETTPVFRQHAQAHNAEIVFADQVVDVDHLSIDLRQALYRVHSDPYSLHWDELRLDLAGAYQRHNLRTALVSAQFLKRLGYDLSEAVIERACLQVTSLAGLIGRWQILSETPLTIADSGHNEEGWQYIVDALRQYPIQRWHIVLGTVSDKNLDFLWALLPKDARYYYCKADVPRGLAATQLAEQGTATGHEGTAYGSVMEAYEAAKATATDQDGIFIGGSIFVVAEVV